MHLLIYIYFNLIIHVENIAHYLDTLSTKRPFRLLMHDYWNKNRILVENDKQN